MRSDTRTRTEKEAGLYSDFDSSFRKNPITGSLIRIVDDSSVKQSIRNLILTTQGEWPHHPSIGSKIYHMLFEPLDSATSADIKSLIYDSLQHEPRAYVHEVIVAEDIRQDGYDIKIVFSTINTTTPIVLNEFLRRIR